MTVFLHTLRRDAANWHNASATFARLPILGEHVALTSSSPWFKVTCVVQIALEAGTQYEAEVYAVEVDHAGAVAGARRVE